MSPSKATSLVDLVEDLVAYARSCGADEAEASVQEGYEFNVDVRMGRIEHLVEAGSRVCGIRVIKGGRTAFASSSDLARSTLRRLIRGAVKRADLAHPDDCAGLAPLSKVQIDTRALDINDPEVPSLDSKTKIELATETEKIALADSRITNSYGAGFVTHTLKTVLANSNGFSGQYDQTYCSLGLGLQAGDTDSKVEDSWFTSKRHFKHLARPEDVARKAVERTVRQLRPRKVKTQRVPVIFEPTQTSWLVAFLFSCVKGTAVFRKATFLADKLGRRIGNAHISVIDDGRMPGGIGTRPFDSDGVSTQKTAVVDKGILKHFLCNTYSGRKLNLPSTGNGDGTGISPGNFFLAPGTMSPRAVIASTKRGLLLTRTIGHGLNPVTGDISRGAFGLWVEDGEIVYPVSEITISGNLGEILHNIEAVGNDLEFIGPVAGPTVKVAEMTVAGE